MNTQSCTLWQLLKLDELSNRSELGARIASQKDRLQVEVAVPWKKIERKMVDKIVEMLDVSLLTLCTAAWKKCEELQEFADPEAYGPDEENEVDLVEHDILLEQHAELEIAVAALPFKCGIPLDLTGALI